MLHSWMCSWKNKTQQQERDCVFLGEYRLFKLLFMLKMSLRFYLIKALAFYQTPLPSWLANLLACISNSRRPVVVSASK